MENVPFDRQVDKNDLEERRKEMLDDNRLEKYNAIVKNSNEISSKIKIYEENKR
jgi:hypothetical protein